jgi:hypothetical protein
MIELLLPNKFFLFNIESLKTMKFIQNMNRKKLKIITEETLLFADLKRSWR